jgi:AMMECR1 domain-containing protein
MEFYFDLPPQNHKSLSQFIRDLPVLPQYRKPAGVFVTLSQKGHPRACWGNVFPEHHNLVESTAYATIGALTKDYRYKPINSAEYPKLKAQVTVVTAIEPISSINGQNPRRDGLMVRAGGKSGVILPGETVDATYQLVQGKLKAGIQPNQTCQLYRIKTEIYE